MTLEHMGLNEWLIIGAALAGPVLAVQAQKWVELVRAEANKRAWIFETLMTTRGARLSHEHVRALNAIDLAFYGRRIFGVAHRERNAQEVIDAWRNYHAHLSRPVPTTPEGGANWGATSEERFVNLLAALAKANRYNFERSQLQSGGYTPMAYTNVDQEQQALRMGLMQVIGGYRTLPVEVRRPARAAEAASSAPANDAPHDALAVLPVAPSAQSPAPPATS
ncbi:DUF6680 family protein [Variovorax sp. M-6]|uniref:DUF6680 family protein n=1 Tax=Variovorax sp. M-6 TaxID=3233041 RepID=UPI003F976748